MKTQAIKAIAVAALLGVACYAGAAGNRPGGGGGMPDRGFHGGSFPSGGFHNGGLRGGRHEHDGFHEHHHHFHHGVVGVFIGGAFWWPWPGYPAYVGQPTVFYDLGQPVWYCCANPPGYYPYVGSCLEPWRHVPLSAEPPDQP